MSTAAHSSLRISLCLLTLLGVGKADAFSPAFCRDDMFPIDVSDTHLPVVPPSRLFPDLSIDDFPRAPNSSRVQVIESLRDELSFNAFHRSDTNLGRFARMHAQVTINPKTGRERFKMTRLDNACVATATKARLSPERVCASLTVDELLSGAYTLLLQDPMQNHQLQFSMTQSLQNPNEWNLVPSKRTGEPEHLQLTTFIDANRVLHSHWAATDIAERAQYLGEVSAEIALTDVQVSRFDPFQMGLLTGLDFLDEMTDIHRDWVLYNEEVDLFEEPPSPGDEDSFYGCEPVSPVCGAEYDTCVATPGGWLGCNIDPDEHWGGGNGGSDGGGNFPIDHDDDDPVDEPPVLPDWQVGSFLTTPKYPAPKFHGLHLDYDANGAAHYGFSYDLTSLLQKAATTPKPFPQAPETKVEHVVALLLTTDNGTPICGVGRKQSTNAATIPIGANRLYRSPDATCANEADFIQCVLPGRGIYELHYDLDTKRLWDEGSDGESNNFGTMGTVYLHD